MKLHAILPPLISLVPLLATGLIVSGCPSGAELENAEAFYSGGGGEDDEPCDVTPILAEKCGTSICHDSEGGDAPPGGTDFFQPGYEGRIVDLDAVYPKLDGCPDVPEKIIDSSNPENSLLLRKLRGTQECGDGMPIPYPLLELSDAEMACFEDWVQHLAENGGSTGPGGSSGMPAPGASGGSPASSGGSTGSGGGAAMASSPLRVEAECVFGASCNGVTASEMGTMQEDTVVGFIDDTDTLTFNDLGVDGYDTVTLNYSKGNTSGGALEVRLGSASGELLGTLTPQETADWTTFQTGNIALSSPLTGTQTIVLVATGAMGVLNIDWIEFSSSGSN